MRLEWLEDILAVADTGSFSDAAERRGLTQSAFSRRIRHIEEHLGVELFDRSRKPVQPHPTTEAHRETIEQLAASLRQLVIDLRKGARTAANRIVIASQHALTAALTPAILDEIRSGNEEIYVRLRSANLDECMALLLSRAADIAIVYRMPGTDHPVRPDFIEVARIGDDRLVPVIGRDHAGRLRAEIARGEVPFIAYPADVFLGQVMERAILPPLRHRLAPVPRAETALTLAAIEMAAVGLAVAWVPASLARGRIAEGGLIDLTGLLVAAALEVTAVRLFGSAAPIEDWVWSRIVGRGQPVPGA